MGTLLKLVSRVGLLIAATAVMPHEAMARDKMAGAIQLG